MDLFFSKFVGLQEALWNSNISIEYFSKLRKEVLARVPLQQSFWVYNRNKFLRCIRCPKKKFPTQYERAMGRLRKETDLVRLLKNMQKLNIMKKVLLDEHQYKLLSFFK